MSGKRSIIAAIAVAAISIPTLVFAQPHPRQSVAPEVAPLTYKDGSDFARAVEFSRQARRMVGPTASHDSSDDVFVFPLAGNTPGAFGTFFRSEATIVNQLNRNQRIGIYFFPAGAGTCNSVPYTEMTLAPFNFYVWTDFVAQVFSLNGLGSLGIVALTGPGGSTDTTAAIDGTLRIYTPLPGGAPGNASQNFDSAALSTWPGNESAFGLRHDGNVNYRTNYGIFNYLGFTRQFSVTFTGTTGAQTSTTVNVAPCSVSFQNVPNLNYGSVLIDIQPTDTNGGWYGFAASNDNNSGDSWSISARP